VHFASEWLPVKHGNRGGAVLDTLYNEAPNTHLLPRNSSFYPSFSPPSLLLMLLLLLLLPLLLILQVLNTSGDYF
jgi:hypothetical protein